MHQINTLTHIIHIIYYMYLHTIYMHMHAIYTYAHVCVWCVACVYIYYPYVLYLHASRPHTHEMLSSYQVVSNSRAKIMSSFTYSPRPVSAQYYLLKERFIYVNTAFISSVYLNSLIWWFLFENLKKRLRQLPSWSWRVLFMHTYHLLLLFHYVILNRIL